MKVKRKIGLDGCIGNAYFNFKESDSIHAPIWNFYPKQGEGFERVHERELEFLEDREKEIDWEQRRYEIAKDAMTAIMSNSEFYRQTIPEDIEEDEYSIPVSICITSVEFADALINELKYKEHE